VYNFVGLEGQEQLKHIKRGAAMRSARLGVVGLVLLSLVAVGFGIASAQQAAQRETGYAVKKPVVGAACPTCPWGAMAEVIKAAMKPYGWDVQICYYCAGGPREARLVSKAAMATPPQNPSPDDLPTPKGPLDFGVTGAEFLQWAYLGLHDFAKDPGTPQKQLRVVANIQEPTYYLVAVKADSGINNLSEIVEKKLPVKLIARTGIGGEMTPTIMQYYGISEEKVESFGGTFGTGFVRENDSDVLIGFGSLVNAPEYNDFYEMSQKYDLRYLELAPDLRARLAKEFYVKEGTIPAGLLRGVNRPIPTVVRNGTVIYGRDDMPDDFAYTLAKAMDEQQELLMWTHMNWSYNYRTVWKALDVPLHPGAARYYREKGYMK
jgi:TRAP transporter TAXI family solute receptor